ncbi:unnamed protein product [marine sediment metagenome]|uniref:Uncharacterized protein n=1 Tax=marine sediment metagenome TaxID=412755 RepID=X1CM68_9ZZZZ
MIGMMNCLIPTTSKAARISTRENKIQERQRTLKQLVTNKKAGLVGIDEFETRYRKLQDELTELETIIYNMKLGTDVK